MYIKFKIWIKQKLVNLVSTIAALLIDAVPKKFLKNNRLIMVMGYQRSGTNALFNSFITEGVFAYREIENNFIYNGWLLRPEKFVRWWFRSPSKPVIIKPITESYVRSIDDVIEEYKNYDLSVVYIFRDPVNVYYSNVLHDPAEYQNNVTHFINLWNKRNRISLTSKNSEKVMYVQYEQLIQSASLYEKLVLFLRINGQKKIDRDSNAGYKKLTPEIITKIQTETAEVFQMLKDKAIH